MSEWERDNSPQILDTSVTTINFQGERENIEQDEYQDFQDEKAAKTPIKYIQSLYDMKIEYEDDKDLKNSTRRNRQEREQHKQVKIVTFESNYIEQKNIKIRRTRKERSTQIIIWVFLKNIFRK